MIELKIQVDIQNHKEIAETQGEIFKLLPAFLLVGKVEEEVKKQLTVALNKNIKAELALKGVKAKVSIR
ncbi:MAG TPA: hypothetical protein VIK72_04715 [Clostridiaceae bacterium]